MKKYRNNLLLPALMHVLLFIYPTLEKVTHQHEHVHEETHSCSSGSLSFNTPEPNCAVCDFQFVNFVITSPPQVTVASSAYAVFRTPPTEAGHVASIRFFHLRAPPSDYLISPQIFV
ncbi:MAG: hypothetical protein AAGU19_04515 [Prolixibacteraceae bacterium]